MSYRYEKQDVPIQTKKGFRAKSAWGSRARQSSGGKFVPFGSIRQARLKRKERIEKKRLKKSRKRVKAWEKRKWYKGQKGVTKVEK
jgi:hypothetical protein